MNKFFLISVCALMALASAQDEPSPMVKRQTSPLASLQMGLQAFLPENICSPSCNAVCTATSIFCITVPGLVDCGAIKAQCDGLCTSGCGCLKNCRTQCQASNPCTSSAGVAGILCQGRVNTCVAVCQASCPAQTSFAIFQQTFQATFKQFQGFLAAFMGSPSQSL